MLTRKLLPSLVAAMGLAAVPALAAVEYTVIELEAAPPAMRVEVTPPAREGVVWIPGYWDYRDGYNWIEGHFEPAREGYVYVAPRYEQRDGRWRMYAGGWDRRGEEEHGGLRNRITEKLRGVDKDDEEHRGTR